jgi:hypothetical protein
MVISSSAFSIYWPFFASIIGGIITFITIWINLNNKVNDLKAQGADRDKEIAELKGRINTMQPDLGTIKTDIAVIKNTLEYIKGSVQGKPPMVTNNNN